MEFGIFSFVIFFAVLQRKFCDAIPTVTLTGKNTFYDGDILQLSCAVDEDVDLLSVSFFKGITETIWINNPTTCTFFKLVPEDTSTYSTTCNSKRIFTMKKDHLNVSDDRTDWSCQMKSTPGGNGSCVGINNPCTSKIITLSLQVPSAVSNSVCPEKLPYGLGIALAILIVVCIIWIVIFIVKYYLPWLGLGIGLLIIICCIICIVILFTIGEQCQLQLRLGLGIAYIMIIVICIIMIFFRKVIIQSKETLQRHKAGDKDVKITAIIYGLRIFSVEWIRGKKKLTGEEDYAIEPKDSNRRKTSLTIKSVTNSETYICWTKGPCGCCSAKDSIRIPYDIKRKEAGSRSDVSRRDVMLQMEENGLKNNESPPSGLRSKNKVDLETEYTLPKSGQKGGRPLLAKSVELEDKPVYRPQPPLPLNNDNKDQNQRGISATYNDTQGLPTETPISSMPPRRLAPIQSPVEDAVDSEEPKKEKKGKKKKDQPNEGNSKE